MEFDWRHHELLGPLSQVAFNDRPKSGDDKSSLDSMIAGEPARSRKGHRCRHCRTRTNGVLRDERDKTDMRYLTARYVNNGDLVVEGAGPWRGRSASLWLLRVRMGLDHPRGRPAKPRRGARRDVRSTRGPGGKIRRRQCCAAWPVSQGKCHPLRKLEPDRRLREAGRARRAAPRRWWLRYGKHRGPNETNAEVS